MFLLHPDVLVNRNFDPSNLVLSPPPPLDSRNSTPHYNNNNSNHGKLIQQSSILNFNNNNHSSSTTNDQIYLNENGKRKSPEFTIKNNNNNLHQSQKNLNDLNLAPPSSKRSALSPLRLHSNTPNLSPSPTLLSNNNMPQNLMAPIQPNLSFISPIASPHGMFASNNQMRLEDAVFLKEFSEKEKNLNNCKLELT